MAPNGTGVPCRHRRACSARVRPPEHAPYGIVQVVTGVCKGVHAAHRRARRRSQLGCMPVVEAAPNVSCHDLRDALGVDESQAVMRRDDDPLEDVQIRHREHVLKDADLRSRAAQDGRAAAHSLIADGSPSVISSSRPAFRSRVSRCAATGRVRRYHAAATAHGLRGPSAPMRCDRDGRMRASLPRSRARYLAGSGQADGVSE